MLIGHIHINKIYYIHLYLDFVGYQCVHQGVYVILYIK